jgi:hypothetical protein
VSPQFHVVYDDYFTTTKCLQTNTLPHNWSHLLETASEKYVDDDFDPAPFTDTSVFQQPTEQTLLLSQRENNIQSSLQREDASLPSLQREESTQSAPVNWNPDHLYATHFRQKFQASNCLLDPEIATPFDDNLY